jgi:hypothetical protein
MKTKIEVLKNFFTKKEEDILRSLVEQNRKLERGSSRFAPMIIKSMSREQIEFLVPEEIKEKLLSLAKQFVKDPDLELTHYQYLDYFGKYGEGASPNLPPHLDVENYYTKVSIDYQMSSNIDWAIVVEDNKSGIHQPLPTIRLKSVGVSVSSQIIIGFKQGYIVTAT